MIRKKEVAVLLPTVFFLCGLFFCAKFIKRFVPFMALSGLAALLGLAATILLGRIAPHIGEMEIEKISDFSNAGVTNEACFLSTAKIDGVLYYFYFIEYRKKDAESRIYQLKTVEAMYVTVREEKRTDAILKIIAYKLRSEAWNLVAVNTEPRKYEFIIPEGTLKKDFSPH